MDDSLGDRMKGYEQRDAGHRFLPMLPVLARLDGRNFSKFTAGLRRPFDERLSALMIETTTHLVRETGAVCGYTQSDEITLAFYASDWKSQIYFDGRASKMTSILAAECSTLFNRLLPDVIPERAGSRPVFDCRVWQVPTLDEGANAFLWREQDATKNSITMAAQEFYSHNQLHGKDGREKQEMLHAQGVNWNDYPAFFKRGTYVRRRTLRSKLSEEELAELPPKHNARLNPDLEFERSVVTVYALPPLAQVHNRAAVIFLGEDPVTEKELYAGKPPRESDERPD